ncbi:MAG TPA: hypothetical protein VF250_07940 [Conexibacter sp.]
MLSLASSTSSSGYVAGEICAIVVLAAAAIALGLRAARRRAAPPAALVPAATVVDVSGSVGPPGWTTPVTPPAPVPPTRGGRAHAGWRSDAVAAAAFAVLCVGALWHFADDRPGGGGPWDTEEGRATQASFMQGCMQTADPRLEGYCRCVFDELTSAPPYDTPQRLAALDSIALRARVIEDYPPRLVAVARACIEQARSPA